jgi:D-sedoheptulose 7-phosphate isomerase
MHNLYFEKYLSGTLDVIEKTKLLIPMIEKISEEFLAAITSSGTIFWCGNGGSASDAQHLAAELVGRFELNRSPMASIALTTDTSILTSIANDYSFEEIFSRQIEALGRPGDVIVGITTSGESLNVIDALRKGKGKGLRTVLFTSEKSKSEFEFVDFVLKVPSSRTCHIQEAHIVIGQAICGRIEKELFGK